MIATNAKRRVTHAKVRTGCESCKSRRVKCDEQKPTCARCEKRHVACKYIDPPKAWVFEPSSTRRNISVDLKAVRSSDIDLSASLIPKYGTAEEQLALDYYVRETGPWLGSYGSQYTRPFWDEVLPRVAWVLPAVRYTLTAVSLLTMPATDPTPQALQKRTNDVMRNYNRAIHELTQPSPHIVDSGLAPVMAWCLETLCFNEDRAAVHERGAQGLFNATVAHNHSHPCDDFIFDDKFQSVLYLIFRLRCLRCKTPRPATDGGQIYAAVTLRNTNASPLLGRIEKLLADFEKFAHRFRPDTMSSADIITAEDFAHKALRAIVRCRNRSSQSALFNAMHLLADLVLLLLPTPVINNVAGERTIAVGIEYVLEECYWLSQPQQGVEDEATKAPLRRAIELMLQLIANHDAEERRRLRARDMLACLKRGGSLEGVVWVMPCDNGDVNRVPENHASYQYRFQE